MYLVGIALRVRKPVCHITADYYYCFYYHTTLQRSREVAGTVPEPRQTKDVKMSSPGVILLILSV